MGIILDIYTAFTLLVFLFIAALDMLSYWRRSEDAAVKSRFRPKALVIVPCRGNDLTLKENLESLKGQDYVRYDLVAVVDSPNDDAVHTIRELGIRLAVSGKPQGTSSGKVNAILFALGRFKGYGVYVIADSDITVDESWLSCLIRPLADKRMGISTMFPYFNPVGGFWTKVKMAWGFVGESLLESPSSRFGWGGSLAFRKSLLDKEFFSMARGSVYGLSDDILLTRTASRKGLGIAYTKLSQPVVNSGEDYSQFIEWSNRQTALTLLGYRPNFYRGVIYYSSEIVLFVSGIALAVFVSPIFIIYLLHFARSLVRTFRRSRRFYWELFIIVPIMPFLYLSNLLAANGMKEISWRGRRYPVK